MKNDIISMYYNFLIKPVENIFKNNIKDKHDQKELDSLYMNTLLAIEDEINYCTKK